MWDRRGSWIVLSRKRGKNVRRRARDPARPNPLPCRVSISCAAGRRGGLIPFGRRARSANPCSSRNAPVATPASRHVRNGYSKKAAAVFPRSISRAAGARFAERAPTRARPGFWFACPRAPAHGRWRRPSARPASPNEGSSAEYAARGARPAPSGFIRAPARLPRPFSMPLVVRGAAPASPPVRSSPFP